MATEQLLLRLPGELVRRFRHAVPQRQRSAFIRALLEQALDTQADDDEDPLYLAALAVEEDVHLSAEMVEWEDATTADGFDEPPER